ncbi:AarF/ABC1/UbiB kinase family protein [Tateyamaria omphalii]|uniref:ABC1 kinase family protein n=1 Tax=Tateyamaria omphalii TaxID=299262 RepID=UPI001C99C63D|nr:AarF/ABC1/UbiB kinase family protein [Tateyamaria omphalii]MBY5932620.1 AarF/ABC1/UbiB kinase family protein [Tateyamaria omphalii]
MADHSNLSRPLAVPAGRLSRFGRMGAMAAGVAGRMALDGARHLGQGTRPNARDLLLTPANMHRIADELARMRGAAMKVGQLVSMDTGDVLPPELADIMARLRADADFMPPKQLRDVLDAEWGSGWRARFAEFDVRPIAAASIGQVHRARLPDGTELAIKVQYPGISRSIDSDVANIARLIRLSGLLPDGFDLDPYLDEARAQLREEADYQAEAAHLEHFSDLLGTDDCFVLPRVHAPLSTKRVLAMTYIRSEAIESVVEDSQEVRDRVMRDLCSLVLRELFDFGVMQTDPNFANYRFDPETGRIVLLDFGATRAVPSELAVHMRDLIRAGFDDARDDVSEIVAEMGLVPRSVAAPFRTRILDMIMLVFEELRRYPLLDLGVSDLSSRLQQMGEALARDGFVPPPVPMDLLYVQRKVAGMFLLARRLNARVPVADLIAPHAGRA